MISPPSCPQLYLRFSCDCLRVDRDSMNLGRGGSNFPIARSLMCVCFAACHNSARQVRGCLLDTTCQVSTYFFPSITCFSSNFGESHRASFWPRYLVSNKSTSSARHMQGIAGSADLTSTFVHDILAGSVSFRSHLDVHQVGRKTTHNMAFHARVLPLAVIS